MFHKKSLMASTDAHFPFVELDKHTQPLRKISKEFANLLASSKTPTPELNALITAIEKISVGQIQKMDQAFLSF